MIRFFLSASIFFWLTLAAPALYAQQKQHTLGDLWSLVEKNYPGIMAKQSDIESAKYSEKATKSNALPQAKMQMQNNYGTYEASTGGFFQQPGLFNVNGAKGLSGSSTVVSTFGSATVEFELFAFGRQQAENKAAEMLTTLSSADKESYLINLKKELSTRYIQVIYNSAKLKWIDQNATRLFDIKKSAAGLARSGIKPAADSLLAYSSYIQALAERDNLVGNKIASIQRLKELHGQDVSDYSYSEEGFIKPTFSNSNPVLINHSHPFLETFDKQSSYHELNGIAQKRSALPSIKILGGYAFRGSGIGSTGSVSGDWKDGFSNSSNNVLVGLGLSWNLTNLYSNKLKANAQFKKAEKAKFMQSQYELQMVANLEAAKSKISEQQKQLTKTAEAVKHVLDAYDMYMARYKSGLITLTELLQIRMLLEQAENNHIEASRSYWLQLANEAELTNNFDFLFNNL
jgi:outer membrane protein TolC